MAGKVGDVMDIQNGATSGPGFTVSGDGRFYAPLVLIFESKAEAEAAREKIKAVLATAVAVVQQAG